MPIIETRACQCALCGHTWIPSQWKRGEEGMPRFCASCKSPKWNEENPRERKPRQARTKRAPIERQSPAEAMPEEKELPAPAGRVWSEEDQAAARKNNHELGCACIWCNRVRDVNALPPEEPKKRKPGGQRKATGWAPRKTRR